MFSFFDVHSLKLTDYDVEENQIVNDFHQQSRILLLTITNSAKDYVNS